MHRMAFHSGGAASLSMSCASYPGFGHRLEFYGEDGNPDAAQSDRRITCAASIFTYAQRPATALAPVDVDDPFDRAISRRRPYRAGIPAREQIPRRHLTQASRPPRISPRLSCSDLARRRAPRSIKRPLARLPRPIKGAIEQRESSHPGHRRQRLHRLGAGQGAGEIRRAVRVLDDNSRGAPRRLHDVENDIEFIGGDVRDAAAVARAVRGMDEVHHLAFVNGTEFFYSAPDLVLDVGVKGMINVIDACRAPNASAI